ncbi:MAG: hypothetical protein KAS99_01410 [Candidatus Omnitrophica bacterium]|nr:hypothetical protein [Candidatus Omnitrophota bacterium]
MEEKTKDVQKKEEKKISEGGKSLVKYVLGVLLVVLGLVAVIGLWASVWIIIKGCIGLVLIIAGAVTIAIAKE